MESGAKWQHEITLQLSCKNLPQLSQSKHENMPPAFFVCLHACMLNAFPVIGKFHLDQS